MLRRPLHYRPTPLQYEPVRPVRERAVQHLQRFDADQGLMLAIPGVKVRRPVVPPEDSNDYAIEIGKSQAL